MPLEFARRTRKLYPEREAVVDVAAATIERIEGELGWEITQACEGNGQRG